MRTILLFSCLFIAIFTQAQSNLFWSDVNENALVLPQGAERNVIPQKYHLSHLALSDLKSYLLNAPMQRTNAAHNNPLIIELPMPDGTLESFGVFEAPTMSPALAAKFPQIKSYSGRGIQNQSLSVRFSYSDRGFDAVINAPDGKIFISPYASRQQDFYQSYFSKDNPSSDQTWVCGVNADDHFLTESSPFQGLEFSEDILRQSQATARDAASEPVFIREYKLAMACTGEWAALHGGTVSGALSAMNTAVNILNSIYEPQMAIRFVLIENNDIVVFTDPSSDPYVNVTNGGGLLDQNQVVLDNFIGSGNYDIGHVMTIGCTGGLAGIAGGTVCSQNGKGKGVTCQGGGSLEGIILEIASHEIAHQFTASHTWDNCPDWLGQRAGSTAFEPGSGSTIMSYSGSCGDQDVTNSSSPYYFHAGSLQQMFTFSHFGGGSTCPDLVSSSNNTPELEIPLENGFYIPISTPFELTAQASDSDGDNLTYCWEQYNTGPIAELGNPVGNSPSFRSYPPVASPTRVFPRMHMVVINGTEDVEVLPTYTRNLKFRCSVRDNNPEIGGVAWEEVSFEATNQAGPFRVTYPNNSIQWKAGAYTEVTWDVANTDGALVNCQKVNIKLSTDGGYNYPITLAENVPNNGSFFVVVPNIISNSARVRVEAADNIFFDISNTNFEIIPASESGYALNVFPYDQQVCIPDPAFVHLDMFSLLGYDSLVSFTINGLPEGAVPVFSANPALPSEGSTLTIETDNVTEEGIYALEITATAPNADTSYRTVFIKIVNSDFSGFEPLTPVNGSSGVSELPTFSWAGTPNADAYSIEIATSPVFGDSIVDSATGIAATSYTPSIVLEKSTLYFWRIFAYNECGSKVYEDIQAFHTETFLCANYESVNVPINISNVGTPTIESAIIIPVDGNINDLNITKVKGNHDKVNHIDVSLISPANTEVVLFGGVCIATSTFNAGFDDEAPSEIQCPPIGVYQPEGSLSDFNGQSSQGTWTLKISVNNPDGAGGVLQEWGLQLCSNVSQNAPYLVTNDTLFVAPGDYRLITNEFLLSEDDDNLPSELTYTLITVPQNGAIFFLDNQLEVGQTFRQSSIDAGNVKYFHDGGPSEFDAFTFAVTDGEGGWFGTPKFNIKIDADVISGDVKIEKNNNEVFLFPNPASDILNVQFKYPLEGKLYLNVSNVQGQVVQSGVFENVDRQLQVNTSNLLSGIYFVQIKTGEQVFAEKVIIQK